MTTFAIIAPTGRADLTAAVQNAFQPHWYEFSPGQFVVRSNSLTSQGVTQAIGANGEVGQLVVFAIAGWWGFHNRQLWEWLSIPEISS